MQTPDAQLISIFATILAGITTVFLTQYFKNQDEKGLQKIISRSPSWKIMPVEGGKIMAA